jgi:hypothetical protein
MAGKYADWPATPSRARKSGLRVMPPPDVGGESPRSDRGLPEASCYRSEGNCPHKAELCFSRPWDFLRAPVTPGAVPSPSVVATTPSFFDIVVDGFVTLISRPLFLCPPRRDCHETNLSTQGASAEAPPRLPSSHADPIRSRRPRVTAPQGTQAPRRLSPARFGTRATSAGSFRVVGASGVGPSPWWRLRDQPERPVWDWWSDGGSAMPSIAIGPSDASDTR